MFNLMEDVVKIGGSCCAWFANLMAVVLVLSVFKAHRDLSICMTLKIKKSFSLCFRSAKY